MQPFYLYFHFIIYKHPIINNLDTDIVIGFHQQTKS